MGLTVREQATVTKAMQAAYLKGQRLADRRWRLLLKAFRPAIRKAGGWDEDKHPRDQGRFASKGEAHAGRYNRQIDAAHRAAREGGDHGPAANAALDRAASAVRKNAVRHWNDAQARARAAVDDPAAADAIIAGHRPQVVEAWQAVQDALTDRHAHPGADAPREDRDAGRADVRAAVARFHAAIEGVVSQAAANGTAVSRNQSFQAAVRVAARTAAGKPVKPGEMAAAQAAGRWATVVEGAGGWQVRTPAGDADGFHFRVGADGAARMYDDQTGQPTSPREVDARKAVRKAVPGPIFKAAKYDETKHPRDDAGRFVSKDDLKQAAKDPEKAAELRDRVTDPEQRAKLNAAIAGPAAPDADAPAEGEGKAPRARRAARAGERPAVDDTVAKFKAALGGPMTADAAADLAALVQRHTGEEVAAIRKALGLRVGGDKAAQVRALVERARAVAGRVEGADRLKPVSVEDTEAKIRAGLAKGMSAEDAAGVAAFIQGHTAAELTELKRRLGLAASGPKAELAAKIAERARLRAGGDSRFAPRQARGVAAPKPAPNPVPVGSPEFDRRMADVAPQQQAAQALDYAAEQESRRQLGQSAADDRRAEAEQRQDDVGQRFGGRADTYAENRRQAAERGVAANTPPEPVSVTNRPPASDNAGSGAEVGGKPNSVEPWQMTRTAYGDRIENAEPSGFATQQAVDWGGNRGQGKRVGAGGVRGAMADPPRGNRVYQNPVGNLPEDQQRELTGLEKEDKERYARARNAGFNHTHALLAAHESNNPGQVDSHRHAVEAAVKAGKPVPPEVLADYPDLARAGGTPPAPAQPAAPPRGPVEEPPAGTTPEQFAAASQAAGQAAARASAAGPAPREISEADRRRETLARATPTPPADDPRVATGRPKSKAGREQIARQVQAEWAKAKQAMAGGGKGRDVALTPEQKEIERKIMEHLQVLTSGTERDGPNDLGPVSDARYSGYHRSALGLIDKLKAAR